MQSNWLSGKNRYAECIQIDKTLKDLIHNDASENEISDYVFKDNQSIDKASIDLIAVSYTHLTLPTTR